MFHGEATHGDPLALSIYGLALLPPGDLLEETDVTQKWYAGDGNTVGSLKPSEFTSELQFHGLALGYNITKCHRITKDLFTQKAEDIMGNLHIKIVQGQCPWTSQWIDALVRKILVEKKADIT